MKALVVFYSMYGHVYKMAEAIAEGVKEVPGTEVALRRVPETLPQEVLQKMGAVEPQKAFAHVPVCTVPELAEADGILFGTPTRYGNMCGQMRQFLDATGQLWLKGALVGKVGSVFVSTATQHGGQESTILSFHISLLHQGMIVVGLPYTFQEQMRVDEITGG
ncbi:MAG: NAD(P)H:quinone oxidoreductase, partial [Candidatus Deferrimicrobiaceae bacterium]